MYKPLHNTGHLLIAKYFYKNKHSCIECPGKVFMKTKQKQTDH